MCLGTAWSRSWWREFSPTTFTESFIALVDEVLSQVEVEYSSILQRVERGSTALDT